MITFIFADQNVQILAITMVGYKLTSLGKPFSLSFTKLRTKNGQLSVALEPKGVGVRIREPMTLIFGRILVKADKVIFFSPVNTEQSVGRCHKHLLSIFEKRGEFGFKM